MKELLGKMFLNWKLFFLTMGFSFISISLSFAQSDTITIKGRIIDESVNEPIPDVDIAVKGTSDGTLSDENGFYILKTTAKPPFTVVVSYLGYDSKEVEIFEEVPELSINIRPKASLAEVVVVGYGEQNRKDVVGSVTKIDPSDTKTIPTGSFDAQLQGKAPGVMVTTNSGTPGSDVFIRVRGATSINASNDPLYVIDGVFVNNTSLQNIAQERATSPMADINPNDIESIEILKDASAVAIYGSRGANGVVIVTTKRGDYNSDKTIVNLNVSEGLAWAPKNRIWQATTGPEQAMLLNEYNANMGRPLPFRPRDQVINGVAGRGLPEEQPTYDRLQYLYQTGNLRNYDLSAQGGSKNTRYYLGAGYNYQEAIWKPMDFNRISFKINLDHKLNKKITIGTSNILTRTYRNQARPANGGNGTLMQASLNIPTYLPIFDDAGTPLKWVNFDNIYTLTSNVNLWSTSYHYIGNVYADVDLLKNLKFRTTFSFDYNLYDENQYWQRSTILGSAGGLGTQSITQSTQVINEQILRYTKSFARHNFGALVGNTLQGAELSNVRANGTNFPNDSYTQISAAANQTASQFKTNSTLASFFSRVDYNFSRKYYLELTVRADGSSRFGANNKWGYFPAVGAAWQLKEENFLKNVRQISSLKLRTSYGLTGNQGGINDFASLGLWNGGYGYSNTVGTAEAPGTAPFQAANPDLKWEKTAQFNIGLDLGLFKDRVYLDFNVYDKYTTDLLLNIPVPASTGFSSYTANYGEISNRGFELGLGTVNIKKKNFVWKTEFNISQNINTVEKIPATINGFDGRNLTSIIEGHSLYSYWLYNQTGVDPQTGDIQIEDVNGDGVINASDRKVVGSIWPKFFGALGNSFSFKGIDFGFVFNYSYGNRTWNHNQVLGEQGGTLGDNRVLLASQLDRWTTPGQQTMVPRLTAANYSYFELNRFFQDASYIRLRSLTLGYTIPAKLSSLVKIEKLRVYFTGTNLLLFTKYAGSDPETNLGQGNLQGYDYDTPPQPRTVQFGLNITL